MRAFFFLTSFFLVSSSLKALEVDEKLTLRIINTSNSKKTILINRGIEDGLIVGDNAKFFLTEGVVARGELIKASPSRSVWALYRISQGDKINNNEVLNLKITTSLKTTSDPTKMLSENEVPENIPVVGGVDENDMKNDMEDLNKLKQGTMMEPPMLQKNSTYIKSLDTKEGSIADGRGTTELKTLEFFGTFNYSSLSETFDPGVEGQNSTQKDLSELSVSFGMEKYFRDTTTAIRNLSFVGQVDLSKSDSIENSSETTPSISTTNIGGSIGVNWHMFNDPFLFDKMIPFVGATIGLGKTIYTNDSTTSSSVDNGSYNSYSLGIGAKFYAESGFGIRGIFDYYSRSETVAKELTGVDEVTSKSGPRLKIGLSFRF